MVLWALALLFAAAQTVAALRSHHIDAPQIWSGLHSFLRGVSPYAAITNLPFGYDHPPGSTLIDAPLGLLSVSLAGDVIVILSATTCLVAIFALSRTKTGLAAWRVGLAALIVSVSRPYHEELTLANIDLLAMFVMALGLIALERGLKRTGALALALAVCVKPTAALVLASPALARRWRVTLLAVATFAAVTLIGFALVPDSGRFFTSVVPFLTGPEQGHADYNTSFTGVVEYLGLGAIPVAVTELLAAGAFVAVVVRYRSILRDSLQATVAVLVAATLLVPRYSFEVYGLYLVLAFPFILKARGRLEIALAAIAVWFLAVRDVLPLHGPVVERFRELRPGVGHMVLAVLIVVMLERAHSAGRLDGVAQSEESVLSRTGIDSQLGERAQRHPRDQGYPL
jgi:hypothetical protein